MRPMVRQIRDHLRGRRHAFRIWRLSETLTITAVRGDVNCAVLASSGRRSVRLWKNRCVPKLGQVKRVIADAFEWEQAIRRREVLKHLS